MKKKNNAWGMILGVLADCGLRITRRFNATDEWVPNVDQAGGKLQEGPHHTAILPRDCLDAGVMQ